MSKRLGEGPVYLQLTREPEIILAGGSPPGRNTYHLQTLSKILDTPEKFETIHTVHNDVGDEDIIVALLDGVHRGGPVGEPINMVSLDPQAPFNGVPQGFVVVHNQYS